MTVKYERDLETYDLEHGDVLDHNHADRLDEYRPENLIRPEKGQAVRMVLVRDVWDDRGLRDRAWAYVEEGKLPMAFEDGLGEETRYRVPIKYRKELKSWRSKCGLGWVVGQD